MDSQHSPDRSDFETPPNRWIPQNSNERLEASHPPGDRADNGDFFCDECSKVDWASLPSWVAPGSSDDYRDVRPLDETVEQLSLSACRICRILSLIKPASFNGGSCMLRAWSASRALGLSTSGRSDESQATMLFVVLTKPNPHAGGNTSRGSKVHWLAVIGKGHDYEFGPRVLPCSIDWALLKSHIQHCQDSHKRCVPALPSNAPGLRVIDVSTRIVIEAPDQCKYVALSYVWGKHNSSDNGGLTCPPPVIEDAMSATKSLGHRYLWVDKYCIPQDDPTEKHRLIRQMDQIYSSAYFTIIAAAGSDSQTGLPGVSNFGRPPQESVKIGRNTTLLHVGEWSGSEDLSTSTWASRGWTYQEGYLSRRRVVFTKHQALFICNSICAQESVKRRLEQFSSEPWGQSLGGFLPMILSHGDIRRDNEVTNFLASVQEYSKRALSYEEDSLNAFSGVLQVNVLNRRSNPHGVKHLFWGLTAMRVEQEDGLDGIALHLLWFHDIPASRRADFPSWTWAGWGGKLSWGYVSHLVARPWPESMQGSGHRYFTISVEDGDQKMRSIADYASDLGQPSTGNSHLLPPSPRRLRITCLGLPVKFQRIQTADTSSDVVHDADNKTTESDRALLQIFTNTYIAATPRLDHRLEGGCVVLGLLLGAPRSCYLDLDCLRNVDLHCLLVQQRGDGMYERVGLIRYLMSEKLFLDEDLNIIDSCTLPGNGEWFDGIARKVDIWLV